MHLSGATPCPLPQFSWTAELDESGPLLARLLHDVREMALCQGYARSSAGASTHSDACTGVCSSGSMCAPCTRANDHQKRRSSSLAADTDSPGEADLVAAGSHQRSINTLSHQDLKVHYRDLRREYKAAVMRMRRQRARERLRNESVAVSIMPCLLAMALSDDDSTPAHPGGTLA